MTHLWDLCQQCRRKLDAVKRGVWSESTLFVTRIFNRNVIKNEKVHHSPLKVEIDSSSWYGCTSPLCLKGLKEKAFAFSLVFRSLNIFFVYFGSVLGSRRNLHRRLIFVLHNLGETSVIQWMSFEEGNFSSHCDTILVKGWWCINQESESCLCCSQHIVLIRYTYLRGFVTILPTVQTLWHINNILPRTDNSTVKNHE